MKILVLGAGVVGVTTAHALAADGHAVTVVDRQGDPAMETSFANAGHVSHHTANSWAAPGVPGMILRRPLAEDAPYLIRPSLNPRQWGWAMRFLRNCTANGYRDANKRLLQLSRYSVARLRALREKEDLVYDQSRRGVLSLYKTEQDLDHAMQATAIAGETAARRLDWSACVALEPALAQSQDHFAGGVHHTDDETGDARQFTAALAATLQNQGVTFLFNANIRKIVADGDRVTGVMIDRSIEPADAVVVCLGSYSPFFVHPFGIRLPVYPVKGYSVTLPTDGANAAPLVGIQDSAHKIYMSRLGDRLRIAGTAELAGYDRTLRLKRAKSILARALTLFPHGGDPAQAQFWAGLRPMTPDCVPVIGPTAIEGLFLNTGHGSLGWTLSCGSARLLADLVAHAEPEIDPVGYAPDRY